MSADWKARVTLAVDPPFSAGAKQRQLLPGKRLEIGIGFTPDAAGTVVVF